MGDWGWGQLSDADKTSILDGVADGACHAGPFHAEIQLTDRCNLDCGFCCTRRFRGGAELSLDDIARIAGELQSQGCHSITLNGGGEPLLHSDICEVLSSFLRAGLSINHLTTNGTLLSARVADLLIRAQCGQIIVSLNAPTPDEYAKLMGASPRQFHRVMDNIRALIAMRNEAASEQPNVVVQFLVHAGNVSSIQEMYRTATELGVDKVIFNDITGDRWAAEPGSPEFSKEIEAYRRVQEDDRNRGMAIIHSHNVDIAAHLDRYAVRRTLGLRMIDALRSIGGGMLAPSARKQGETDLRQMTDCCIAPWHSMTIRPTAEVPVCCALQDRIVAKVGPESVAEVWHGPGFARVRQQIRRSIREGESWQYIPDRDADIVDFCASNCPRDARCRFRSFYFSNDEPFLHRLKGVIDGLRCELD